MRDKLGVAGSLHGVIGWSVRGGCRVQAAQVWGLSADARLRSWIFHDTISASTCQPQA